MMSKSPESTDAAAKKPEYASPKAKTTKQTPVAVADAPAAKAVKPEKPAITGAKVIITLNRSLIGRTQDQRKVARALGFTKTHQTVEHAATPVILGMVNAISHLVSVEQVG